MRVFTWLSLDDHILMVTNSITSFANSFVSVFFTIFLTLMGLPPWQVGLVLTGGLMISTLLNVITGFFEDRLGRRKVLIFYASLAVLSGIVYAASSNVSLTRALSHFIGRLKTLNHPKNASSLRIDPLGRVTRKEA